MNSYNEKNYKEKNYKEKNPQRRYQSSLRVLGSFYILAALTFFFFPQEMYSLINFAPKILGFLSPLPDATEFFWLVPGTALLALLGFLSWSSAQNPTIKSFPFLMSLTHLISAAGFSYLFYTTEPYFAYALTAVLGIGFSIFHTTAYAWKGWKMRQHQEPSSFDPDESSFETK
jgi:hypothetical protein